MQKSLVKPNSIIIFIAINYAKLDIYMCVCSNLTK